MADAGESDASSSVAPGYGRDLQPAAMSRIGAAGPDGTFEIPKSQGIQLAGGCIAFGLAGAVSRVSLITVPTRYQIASFWLAALMLYAIVRMRRPSVSTLGLALNGIAATIAIVAVRWRLEGLPYLHH